MPVMTSILRRHGATMVERHGRAAAAHFGSATSEAAVCRTTVGLAVRSDRTTIEVLGPPDAVDEALAGLVPLGHRAWSARLTPGLALVRCEGEDAAACQDQVDRSDRASVVALDREYVAVQLLGPRTREVLEAAGVGGPDDPAVVVEEGLGVELLVPAAQGPALWYRVLEAGERFGIACVGLDALEHLAASEHLGIRS